MLFGSAIKRFRSGQLANPSPGTWVTVPLPAGVNFSKMYFQGVANTTGDLATFSTTTSPGNLQVALGIASPINWSFFELV